MRSFSRAGVSFTVSLEEESVEVRGNAMASGDDAANREVENEILTRLDRGDLSAWCSGKVEASIEFNGQTFKGVAYLGCCSYATDAECEKSLIEDYRLDDEARADLIATLESAVKKGEIAAQALAALKAGI